MNLRFLRLVALLLAASLPLAVPAQETWPAKPIRIVVPFAPGGTSDILARVLGERLAAALKQPVVVDNKAGAGGIIGADAVAKSPADGYTFLLGTIATHAINPVLMAKMPYDATRDFAPVILLGSISNVLLVGADQPYQSVRDLIAAAKAKPGDIAFAAAGQGSSQHMSGETFKVLTGVSMTFISYKGSAPAIQDLIGGQTQLLIDAGSVLLPQVKGGKLKALAVTGPKRDPQLPDVPTVRELGLGAMESVGFQGLVAPAGLPQAIMDRLAAELAKVLAQPEVKAKFVGAGAEVHSLGAAEFAAFVKADNEKWARLIRERKLQLD